MTGPACFPLTGELSDLSLKGLRKMGQRGLERTGQRERERGWDGTILYSCVIRCCSVERSEHFSRLRFPRRPNSIHNAAASLRSGFASCIVLGNPPSSRDLLQCCPSFSVGEENFSLPVASLAQQVAPEISPPLARLVVSFGVRKPKCILSVFTSLRLCLQTRLGLEDPLVEYRTERKLLFSGHAPLLRWQEDHL